MFFTRLITPNQITTDAKSLWSRPHLSTHCFTTDAGATVTPNPVEQNLPSRRQSPTCIVLYSTLLAPFCKRCKLEINMTYAHFFPQTRTSFPKLTQRNEHDRNVTHKHENTDRASVLFSSTAVIVWKAA